MDSCPTLRVQCHNLQKIVSTPLFVRVQNKATYFCPAVLSKLSTPQNIIVVDWGRLSGNGNTFANLIETGAAYSKVLANVGPVGSRIADVINFIVTTKNILPSQINIIGHSLGAHIGKKYSGSFILIIYIHR